MPPLRYAHSFLGGNDTATTPVVLLHGTGGTEFDLLPLAAELAPGATKLGIRGTVATDGGHAFFHRLPDRRVDEADLAARVPALADFIETCCSSYHLARRPIAIGFSNGAIMTAALLLTRPRLLAGAILFRPLSPFTDDTHHAVNGTPVLIIDGAQDTRRSPGDGLRLASRLRGAGALVTHHVLPVGHSVTAEDAEVARGWLRELKPV